MNVWRRARSPALRVFHRVGSRSCSAFSQDAELCSAPAPTFEFAYFPQGETCGLSANQWAVSTVSLSPIALVTATNVERRGLPWTDNAR